MSLTSVLHRVHRPAVITKSLTVMLCAALAAPGCATAGAGAPTPAAPQARTTTQQVLAHYVQSLRPGTTVRIERAQGRAIRGTLMRANGTSLFVQPRTRIPEPPIEVPLSEVLSVVPDTGNGNTVAKAIGIGAAAGAAAALTVFLIILAAVAD